MSKDNRIHETIQAHAFRALGPQKQATSNLYLDERIRERGEILGPAFQKIVVEEPSLLVFADDDPLANFGHDCRYLLYHPQEGTLLRDIPARFPPYGNKRPETLKAFHEPVKFVPVDNLFHFPPIFPCPILRPDGDRYAILYSGMSNRRHLNDLEFCYRVLIDRYAFNPRHIYALSYDGTLDTQDGVGTLWPGNNTPYRIQMTGQGNRAAMQAALADLRGKLKPRDLLFIHTNNHGDNSGGMSFLSAYPSWGVYWANEFCADLATLPHYHSLLVMMEQCNSGGFNLPVLAASTAASCSIASAAIASQSSYASPDGNWDSFARDWIAAQAGHNPNGGPLAFNADTNLNGSIEATEAFNYAYAVRNPSDSPNFNENSVTGGTIRLSQQYAIWWTWCGLFWPEIEKYRPKFPPGPDPEFYGAINEIAAELQETLVTVIDRSSAEVRKELGPKIHAAFEASFSKLRQKAG
jgi:hypothetical protein